MTKDIIVKESNINGKGIFAARDFKRGEIAFDWAPYADVLTKEEVELVPEEKMKFVSCINGTYYFFREPARYMNHSCDANTKIEGTTDIAVRDIKEGEEITCDYVDENVPDLQLECNCGSENCKRVIKNEGNT